MKRPKLPRLGALLRQYFLAGVFVILPLGVIAWILSSVVQSLSQLLNVLPEALRPDSPVARSVFVVGLTALSVLGISLLGWVSRLYLGRQALKLIGKVIQRIPVIRSIYSALDQLLRTFASSGGQQFNRAVYVEFPRSGCWTLGFVTGTHKSPAIAQGHINVFVPATPNPTSGFWLIVPETEVRESGLSVEDAFKAILSLGIVQQHAEHAPPLSPRD